MFKFYRVHIEARAYAIFAQVYLVFCVFVLLEVFRPWSCYYIYLTTKSVIFYSMVGIESYNKQYLVNINKKILNVKDVHVANLYIYTIKPVQIESRYKK